MKPSKLLMPFTINLHLFLPTDRPFLVIFLLWFFFLLYETLSKRDKHEANFMPKIQSGHSLRTCHPWESFPGTLATISPKLARPDPQPALSCWVLCGWPRACLFSHYHFAQWPSRIGRFSGGQQHYTKLKYRNQKLLSFCWWHWVN